MARKARLYAWVPVGELLKRGWLQAVDTVGNLERAVCSFLNVSNIGDEPQLVVNLRHSLQDPREQAAQRAWVKRVAQLAAEQEVGGFDAKRPVTAIPELVRLASAREGVPKVPACWPGWGCASWSCRTCHEPSATEPPHSRPMALSWP